MCNEGVVVMVGVLVDVIVGVVEVYQWCQDDVGFKFGGVGVWLVQFEWVGGQCGLGILGEKLYWCGVIDDMGQGDDIFCFDGCVCQW